MEGLAARLRASELIQPAQSDKRRSIDARFARRCAKPAFTAQPNSAPAANTRIMTHSIMQPRCFVVPHHATEPFFRTPSGEPTPGTCDDHRGFRDRATVTRRP